MKTLWYFLVCLCFRQASAAVVRKPPAFSTPVYSDSYLPAAMQVIFHAVEQLKLQSEDTTQNTSTVVSSTSRPVEKHDATVSSELTTEKSTTEKPHTEMQYSTTTAKSEMKPETTRQTTKTPEKLREPDQTSETYEESTEIIENGRSTTEMNQGDHSAQEGTPEDHREPAEVNEETPEMNYATPETNYESPEVPHGMEESNYETSEESQVQNLPFANAEVSSDSEVSSETSTKTSVESKRPGKPCKAPPPEDDKKKKPTVDSIVGEIYEIIKPTPSILIEEAGSDMSKTSMELSVEKLENLEDEEEETRFTLLGEKVAQVPRPSLSSYLKRAKVPLNPSLQQLANLYDALSKDARKQGFGKYAGYSDEVLQTLQMSAEGGLGPQLQKLLGKILERNELTREDARMKTGEVLRDLDNPSSVLSKDLRSLLPLRYSL